VLKAVKKASVGLTIKENKKESNTSCAQGGV